MNIFQSYYYLIRTELIKQMRGYPFLIVLGLTIWIGYLCVPPIDANYVTVHFGNVRGIYNSAWLGGMLAILASTSVWLLGFYLLRSKISEDKQVRMGQLIASAPISKFRYICSKVISNFLTFAVIGAILTIAFIAMQFVRAEDFRIEVWEFLAPYVYILLPSFTVLAALTVLFDTVAVLRGVIGNLVYFFLFMFLLMNSAESMTDFLDVMGIQETFGQMKEGVAAVFPFVKQSDIGGFGINFIDQMKQQTFPWDGMKWSVKLLLDRWLWTVVAIGLTMLAILLFNRSFLIKKEKTETKKWTINRKQDQLEIQTTAIHNAKAMSVKLSPISGMKQFSFLKMVSFELRLMLKGVSIWWYIITLGLIAISFFLPIEKTRSYIGVLWILPVGIWSQMATREKLHRTEHLVATSGSILLQFGAVWIAGVIVSLIMGSGVMIQSLKTNDWSFFIALLVATLFVPTFALVLGSWSHSKKLFEVVYMLWWYLGPMNQFAELDFIGVTDPTLTRSLLFLGITLVFLGLAIAGRKRQMKSH